MQGYVDVWILLRRTGFLYDEVHAVHSEAEHGSLSPAPKFRSLLNSQTSEVTYLK
jgi:hypothetical protein